MNYNTAAYRGEKEEIVNKLVEIKELPKTVLDGSITGYINYNKRDSYNLFFIQ